MAQTDRHEETRTKHHENRDGTRADGPEMRTEVKHTDNKHSENKDSEAKKHKSGAGAMKSDSGKSGQGKEKGEKKEAEKTAEKKSGNQESGKKEMTRTERKEALRKMDGTPRDPSKTPGRETLEQLKNALAAGDPTARKIADGLRETLQNEKGDINQDAEDKMRLGLEMTKEDMAELEQLVAKPEVGPTIAAPDGIMHGTEKDYEARQRADRFEKTREPTSTFGQMAAIGAYLRGEFSEDIAKKGQAGDLGTSIGSFGPKVNERVEKTNATTQPTTVDQNRRAEPQSKMEPPGR